MTVNAPQYITDIKGKRLSVVLSIRDYERLLEELEEMNALPEEYFGENMDSKGFSSGERNKGFSVARQGVVFTCSSPPLVK
jgi:hypothetical protein